MRGSKFLGTMLMAAVTWVTACDGATDPGPGEIAEVTRESGDDQAAAVGERVPDPLVVRVADASGRAIAGAPVTFTVVAGGGSVERGSAVTGPDGRALSGAWTLGPTVGVQEVQAEAGTAHVVFSAVAHVAPTGLEGRLAFVSEREGNPEIYAVDLDGSDLERLTTHDAADGAPEWSPEGELVAFASTREGGFSLFVMRSDGSNVVRWTRPAGDGTTAGEAYDPAWSPDGSAIAFSTARAPEEASPEVLSIARLSEADGGVTFLTDVSSSNSQPSWSPDGEQLAFASDRTNGRVSNIYAMNADDGSGQRRLTQGDPERPDPQSLHPSWSPDGSMIAFLRASPINGSLDWRFQVAIMSPDGRLVDELAWAGDVPGDEGAFHWPLAWSPDGLGIAYTFFTCDLDLRDCPGEPEVRYVSLDRTRQGVIVANAHSPSWRR